MSHRRIGHKAQHRKNRRAPGWGRFAALLTGAAALSASSGCASASKSVYIPRHLGLVNQPDEQHGLKLRVEADSLQHPLGKPLRMRATLQNVSHRELAVPANPILLYAWIYPDGRRDNFVSTIPREQHYEPRDLQILHPGESITWTTDVSTRHFQTAGITEFGAILVIPPADGLGRVPVAEGRYHSNRVGVKIM